MKSFFSSINQYLNLFRINVCCLYFLILASLCTCTRDIKITGIYFSDTNTGNVIKSLLVDDAGGKVNFTASSSEKTSADISVAFEADSSLVAVYNAKYGTNFKPLPQKYFSLSKKEGTIPAEFSTSDPISVIVNPLDNDLSEGDQFIIPIKIVSASGNIPILSSSSVLYLKIERILVNPALDLANTSNITFKIPDTIGNLTAFTVEFRVKAKKFVNNTALFYASPSEIYSRFGDVVIDVDQLQIKYNGVQPSSKTKFSLDTWYHIAYVFDGIKNSFKIYVNGQLDATSTSPSNTTFGLSSMGFGGGKGTQVQELRFWTRALSQIEIQNGACAVNPASDGLYGYWKFNEGTGTTIADATGKGHTGNFTIVKGDPWIKGVRCPD